MLSENMGPRLSKEGSHRGLLGYTGQNGRKKAALCLTERYIRSMSVQADAAEKRLQAAERPSVIGNHCPGNSGKER